MNCTEGTAQSAAFAGRPGPRSSVVVMALEDLRERLGLEDEIKVGLPTAFVLAAAKRTGSDLGNGFEEGRKAVLSNDGLQPGAASAGHRSRDGQPGSICHCRIGLEGFARQRLSLLFSNLRFYL